MLTIIRLPHDLVKMRGYIWRQSIFAQLVGIFRRLLGRVRSSPKSE